MTLKEEFLILWIFCLVVIVFAARHVFGGIAYLVEKIAAVSIVCMPSLMHLLLGHLH